MTQSAYSLTPYDEYPVHQAPHPFSYVPSTDYNWDDGYYWGVFSPQAQVFLAIGMRVNPNTDMVGGYALMNEAGRQLTVRFNRCWRRDFALQIGPFRYELLEPLKRLRLVLDKNDSGLSFDLAWEGVCPAFVEESPRGRDAGPAYHGPDALLATRRRARHHHFARPDVRRTPGHVERCARPLVGPLRGASAARAGTVVAPASGSQLAGASNAVLDLLPRGSLWRLLPFP
jgi:hypothetical protein